MRQSQYTLRPAHVHAHARKLLIGKLRLVDYKNSVPAALLASLLLIAALSNCSLCCACALHPEHPCYQSARNALHANLKPKQATLLGYLLEALLDSVPPWLLATPHPCAIDLHQRCYYGKKSTKGCTRGKSKKGTKKFFTYATLALLSPQGRFTLGLVPVYPKMLLQNIVSQLLDQAQQAGLRIDYLMLDREFGSAEVTSQSVPVGAQGAHHRRGYQEPPWSLLDRHRSPTSLIPPRRLRWLLASRLALAPLPSPGLSSGSGPLTAAPDPDRESDRVDTPRNSRPASGRSSADWQTYHGNDAPRRSASRH